MATARRETFNLAPNEALAPPSPRLPDGPEEENLAYAEWVSGAIFGITLVAGIGLVVYTFLRPFLPASWLP
jgi:hypothetical protein